MDFSRLTFNLKQWYRFSFIEYLILWHGILESLSIDFNSCSISIVKTSESINPPAILNCIEQRKTNLRDNSFSVDMVFFCVILFLFANVIFCLPAFSGSPVDFGSSKEEVLAEMDRLERNKEKCTSSQYWAYKSQLAEILGEGDNSIEYMKSAVKADSNNIDHLKSLSRLYSDMNLFDKQLEVEYKIFEKEGPSAENYSYIALAKFLLRDYRGAIADAKKSIAIDPNTTRAWRAKGAAECRLGLNDDALKSLNRCIELNPEYWPAYVLRAEVFKRIGFEEKAEEDIKTAKSLGWVESK